MNAARLNTQLVLQRSAHFNQNFPAKFLILNSRAAACRPPPGVRDPERSGPTLLPEVFFTPSFCLCGFRVHGNSDWNGTAMVWNSNLHFLVMGQFPIIRRRLDQRSRTE
jgi:hypothetical protein